MSINFSTPKTNGKRKVRAVVNCLVDSFRKEKTQSGKAIPFCSTPRLSLSNVRIPKIIGESLTELKDEEFNDLDLKMKNYNFTSKLNTIEFDEENEEDDVQTEYTNLSRISSATSVEQRPTTFTESVSSTLLSLPEVPLKSCFKHKSSSGSRKSVRFQVVDESGKTIVLERQPESDPESDEEDNLSFYGI